MWRMLTGRGARAARSSCCDHDADHGDRAPRAGARATSFPRDRPPGGQRRVRAPFRFADGRIAEHADSFSFHSWAWQALGVRARVLGTLKVVRAAVRRRARKHLQRVHGRGWMTGSPELRASDAERERAVGRLRERLARGAADRRGARRAERAAYAATTVARARRAARRPAARAARSRRRRAPRRRCDRVGRLGRRPFTYVFEHPVRPGKAMEQALRDDGAGARRGGYELVEPRRARGWCSTTPTARAGWRSPCILIPFPGLLCAADQGARPRHGRVRAARAAPDAAGRPRPRAAAGAARVRAARAVLSELSPDAQAAPRERADTGSHALLRPPPHPPPGARRGRRRRRPPVRRAAARRRRAATSPRRRPRPAS